MWLSLERDVVRVQSLYHMKTIRVEEGKYVEGALVFLLYFPGFCALEAL